MIEVYKFEGKTREECLKKALEELNLSEDELEIREKEITASLFKSKKCEVEMILKKDVKEAIKQFLKELAEQMNIALNIEVNNKDGGYTILATSENNNILIGKDGRTLKAIQTVLKKHISKITDFDIKVSMDIANYRAKQEKNFEYEIKRIAKDVLRTKVEASLEPMNSYKRRIVHTVIGEFEGLYTESIGEGLERHVVVKYKEDA